MIPDLDGYLRMLTKDLPQVPKRYEFRCHPDVFIALRLASDEATARKYTPRAGIATGTPLYGSADIVVRPELGSGGWELYEDGELLKSGRLGEAS